MEESLASTLLTFADQFKAKELEIKRLKRRIKELEDLLNERNVEIEQTYRQNEEKFDALKRTILGSVISLVKLRRGPVSYDAIIKHIQTNVSPNLKAETIARRIRELKAEGALFSPRRGYFYVKRGFEKCK